MTLKPEVKLSYKEKERQRREEDILATAEQLLLERGYASLNMDELAKVVGISKPTLYQHFKGKDELVLQVVMRSYAAVDNFLAQPLHGPAIERLLKIMRRSASANAPGSLMVSLRSSAELEPLWQLLHTNPALAESRQRFKQRVYFLVEKAQEEGDIDKSLPVFVVTHTLFSLNRTLMDTRFHAEVGDDPAALECAIEAVVRIFLNGVTPADKRMPKA